MAGNIERKWNKYKNDKKQVILSEKPIKYESKNNRKITAKRSDYIKIAYLQPIITQYFIDNKSEIWLLFLIAHSKR